MLFEDDDVSFAEVKEAIEDEPEVRDKVQAYGDEGGRCGVRAETFSWLPTATIFFSGLSNRFNIDVIGSW